MSGIDNANAMNIRPSMRVSIKIGSTADGFVKQLYNEDLIRVVVSLRSDLAKISPTLPESEIEIEAYIDEDVSDQVAGLMEGTAVEYRAGYPFGNPFYEWAPTRYFYTDEPIKWENGILYVHAVDQVHKLDGLLPPIFLGQQWEFNVYNRSYYGAFGYLYGVFLDILQGHADYYYSNNPKYNTNAIIKHFDHPYTTFLPNGLMNVDGHYGTLPTNGAVNSIIASSTRREMIAKLMNLCHQEYASGFFDNGFDNFWLTYVDAGRPTITVEKPAPKFQIYYEDCGNVHEEKERRVSEYRFKVREVEHVDAMNLQGMDCVNATVFKQKGMALEYSGLVDTCEVGVKKDGSGVQSIWEIDTGYNNHPWPEKARPYNPYYDTYRQSGDLNKYYYGQYLLDENLVDTEWLIKKYSYYDLSTLWNTPNSYGDTPAQTWADWISDGLINSTDTETSATSLGTYFVTTDEEEYVISTGVNGIVVAPEEYIWDGHILAKSAFSNSELKILPDEGLKSIANRSDTIGSFTWKGDPRMQPRDVVELLYPDENLADQDGVLLQTEDGDDIIINRSKIITLENITLTHENGGTISEITYREGYC